MIPVLDRSEAHRSDEHLLAAASADPKSRFLVFDADRVLLNRRNSEPAIVSGRELQARQIMPQSSVLLGFDGDTAWFAWDLNSAPLVEKSGSASADFSSLGEFASLSSIDGPVSQHVWALLSQARTLLAWNAATARCPVCGGATEARTGGYHRICLRAECGMTHFPRTDPAVIVRVLHEGRCLLARQPQSRPGLRSVIAGFVEPGERLEDTVQREIREEVGLKVHGIRYLGSQPWPFPMSMMIAYEAHALSDAIVVDGNELESADWYTRDQARVAMEDGQLILPSPKSIARHMIDGWLEVKEDLYI